MLRGYMLLVYSSSTTLSDEVKYVCTGRFSLAQNMSVHQDGFLLKYIVFVY